MKELLQRLAIGRLRSTNQRCRAVPQDETAGLRGILVRRRQEQGVHESWSVALGFIQPELLRLLSVQFIEADDDQMREPRTLNGLEAKDFSFQFLARHGLSPK